MWAKIGLSLTFAVLFGVSGAIAQGTQAPQQSNEFSNRGVCADEARTCLSQCRTRSMDDMTADLHCKQRCEAVKASCQQNQEKDERLKEDRFNNDRLKSAPPPLPSPLGEPR